MGRNKSRGEVNGLGETLTIHSFMAALGIDMKGGEFRSRKHVQPVAFAFDPASRLRSRSLAPPGCPAGRLCRSAPFIRVGCLGSNQRLAHWLHRLGSFGSATLDDVAKRADAHRCLEKIGEDLGESLVGDQLVGAKIERGGANFRPILDRGDDPFRKPSRDLCATLVAGPLLGAVFGDLQPDRRQLKNLTTLTLPDDEFAVGLTHDNAALWAAVFLTKTMLDYMIGVGDTFKSIPASAFLPARFATRLAT